MTNTGEPELKSLKRIDESLREQAREATEELSGLAQTVSAEKLFVFAIATLTIARADQISETTHGSVSAKSELLAFHLFPFFGSSANQDITPLQVVTCTEALDQLFIADTILGTYSDTGSTNSTESLVQQVQKQARIVRGSAYQEQTANEIKSVQGQFDNLV